MRGLSSGGDRIKKILGERNLKIKDKKCLTKKGVVKSLRIFSIRNFLMLDPHGL